MSVPKKDKIKQKLSAKKEKLLAKLKGANAAKKAGALAGLFCAFVFAAGCQSTPSRAQTQNIKGCTFFVTLAPPCGATNSVASEAGGAVGDLFTQNMVIENSGTETFTPTQTISPTTTLSYGVGGGDSLGSLLSALKNMLGLNGGAATKAGSTAPAAGAGCSDGSCSVSP